MNASKAILFLILIVSFILLFGQENFRNKAIDFFKDGKISQVNDVVQEKISGQKKEIGSKIGVTQKDKNPFPVYKSGNYDFSLPYGSIKRTYKVHIPLDYDPGKETALVINLHGGGGNAESHIKTTQMDKAADKHGFIVVYPDGTGKEFLGRKFYSWNAGRCCGDAKEKNIDDIGFISAMLEKMEKDFNIDGNRVFVAGYSNGAQMAYRLACEMSDKIAAIAPVAAVGSLDACNPKRPVPILHIDGTADTCSPYGGGKDCGACFAQMFKDFGITINVDTYSCESVDRYIKKWRDINGCRDSGRMTYQKGSATCKTFSDCSDSAEISVCAMEGMKHIWPGGTYDGVPACEISLNSKNCKAYRGVVGELDDSIDANEMMWDFFMKHPLK